MKTINLWVDGKGWQSFDFETAKEALAERKIIIKDWASIGDGASISDGASIGDWAFIGSRASIGDGVVIQKTICITGTKHTVIWYGTGDINIGCHKYTISEWLKSGLEIARRGNYTDEQVNEYRGYVNFCAELQKQIDEQKAC